MAAMKGKTKRRLKNLVLYGLIGVFAIGTLLLYLPVSSPPQNTPPPLDALPEAQQQAPLQNGGNPAPGQGQNPGQDPAAQPPGQAVPVGP